MDFAEANYPKMGRILAHLAKTKQASEAELRSGAGGTYQKPFRTLLDHCVKAGIISRRPDGQYELPSRPAEPVTKPEDKRYALIGRIVEHLSDRRLADMDELVAAIGVPDKDKDAFRKQLERFVEDNLVAKTTRGSYVLAPHAAAYFSQGYLDKLEDHRDEKRAMAEFICRRMPRSATGRKKSGLVGTAPLSIDLDAGTTTTAVACVLAGSETPDRDAFSVFTNNLHVVLILARIATICVPPGRASDAYAGLVGDRCAEAFEAFDSPEVGILAASAVSREAGIGCADPRQHAVKRTIIQRSQVAGRLIVAADDSKLGAPARSIFSDEDGANELRQWMEAHARFVTTLPRSDEELTPEYHDALDYVAEHFWDGEDQRRNRLFVVNAEGEALSPEELAGFLEENRRKADSK